MNLGTIRSAIQRRGMNDVDTDDIDQAINDACVELDSMYLWPYLEKSTTGTPAPLLITDLRQVDEVLNLDAGSEVLTKASWEELAATYGDTSVSGTPAYWYFASPEGVTQIATFPVSDDEIGVQYWRSTPVLDDDADEPLCPDQWHSLIVDLAVSYLYPDDAAPPGLLQRIDRRRMAMVNALMGDYGPSVVGAVGDDC